MALTAIALVGLNAVLRRVSGNTTNLERVAMTQEQYIGSRVEIHPATDAWMRGDRYGEIVGLSRKKADDASRMFKVKMDKSGKVLTLAPNMVKPL